jgi:hypothetical protein
MSPTETTRRQIALIRQLQEEEAAKEAKRRGCFVPPDDPVVQLRLANTILERGEELRRLLEMGDEKSSVSPRISPYTNQKEK